MTNLIFCNVIDLSPCLKRYVLPFVLDYKDLVFRVNSFMNRLLSRSYQPLINGRYIKVNPITSAKII